MKNKIKVILWDFDGVLLNSNEVRDKGFIETLSDYPTDQVNLLMDFHKENGGLSRYVKFRYFFETIRKEKKSDSEINIWAEKFSIIMRKFLVEDKLLIRETMNFVKNNHDKYEMHIVSGSDQEELRFICAKLGIDFYFKSINGSPTPKIKLVHQLIEKWNYNKDVCMLIGDSINDYEAALRNNIKFLGYNNPSLDKLSNCSISFI
jgi:HAD superfamily hydrolase (TIGR01549 family)